QRQRQPRQNRTLTCANCRIRKTRCDGTQPGCKTCEVYNDDCQYEKPPPMSQIINMAKKLQDYERLIERFKTSGYLPSGDQSMADADEPSEAGTLHVTGTVDSSYAGGQSIKSSSPEPLLSDLSLDETERLLCYYGPTSAVHDPPVLSPTTKIDLRTTLASNAIESRTWEEFAMGNAAFQSDVPKESISELLQLSIFMWVYGPTFMRDMTTGCQYFSHFLLLVLCAHSSRFQESGIGEVLISCARLLLGAEIHEPSSIPTIQALLQLSDRDLAFGSISQAWLYSGMAFRMASNLGLQHTSNRMLDLGYLNAEDLEARRRLFWSCYFWDKAISLYLGRMPALTELPVEDIPELLDDFAENEVWTPYEKLGTPILTGIYPEMKSHAVSCFENSCKLAVIINDIILQLYCRRTASDIGAESALRTIREKLNAWRSKSPPHLRYNGEDLPATCPPPHIITQNLLFYTTTILLHRPFYSSPSHHAACRQAAINMEKMVLLVEKTFGFTRITYLMAYCIYTGASVLLPDDKSGDRDARARIDTFLRALEGGRTTCPMVQRSLDIIINSRGSMTDQELPENISRLARPGMDISFYRPFHIAIQ
ncbi:hypothetical protein DL98DRAFT_436466, partial [Cadophora sp. DSE1049]